MAIVANPNSANFANVVREREEKMGSTNVKKASAQFKKSPKFCNWSQIIAIGLSWSQPVPDGRKCLICPKCSKYRKCGHCCRSKYRKFCKCFTCVVFTLHNCQNITLIEFIHRLGYHLFFAQYTIYFSHQTYSTKFAVASALVRIICWIFSGMLSCYFPRISTIFSRNILYDIK